MKIKSKFINIFLCNKIFRHSIGDEKDENKQQNFVTQSLTQQQLEAALNYNPSLQKQLSSSRATSLNLVNTLQKNNIQINFFI